MEAVCFKAGMTREDIRHALMLAALEEDNRRAMLPEILKRQERVEGAVVRRLYRQRRSET